MTDISIIILTKDEELHIARCLENALKLTKNIFVVDCFSTDKTVEIAQNMGAKVLQREWPGMHALQVNWAIENLPFNTSWILRLDADEYLTDALIEEIKNTLPTLDQDVSGIVLHRKHVFMGKLMKRNSKANILRIWRQGKGYCEQRWMDERILISAGNTIELKNDFYDHNLNSLSWWIDKHNSYSTKEAINILDSRFHLLGGELSGDTKRAFYNRLPLFWRGGFFFCYRYFLKMGFLSGKEGFLWDFFQVFWYRTLVDAKILEITKNCGSDRAKMIEYIKIKYNIDCFHGI